MGGGLQTRGWAEPLSTRFQVMCQKYGKGAALGYIVWKGDGAVYRQYDKVKKRKKMEN